MADAMALCAGWVWICLILRRSLPVQNILVLAFGAAAMAAVAHFVFMSLQTAPPRHSWAVPAGLGLMTLASRELGRAVARGIPRSSSPGLIAIAVAVAASACLLVPLAAASGFETRNWGLGVWLGGLVCGQVALTPWFIGKKPGVRAVCSGAAWLWIAMSCYLAARAWQLGKPVLAGVTLFLGAVPGVAAWLSARENHRSMTAQD